MTADDFESLRTKFFDPLATTLGLTSARSTLGDSYAVVSAAAANVRVYFERDRGLCAFAVGAASADRSPCAVEEIAKRFPRIRRIPGGEQRLTLAEQASFITEHWGDLQTMFSPDHMRETLAWRDL
jgi:hypothetical protein